MNSTLRRQSPYREHDRQTETPLPGRGRTKTGYLWAVLRDDRGWNEPAPPGVVFHYRPGRKGEYADEILMGFDGIIQVDAYGGYSQLAKSDRKKASRSSLPSVGRMMRRNPSRAVQMIQIR